MHKIIDYLIQELEAEFPILTQAINAKYDSEEKRNAFVSRYVDIFTDSMHDKISDLIKVVQYTFSE